LTYWENGVTKQIANLASLFTFTYGVDGAGRMNSISASSGQNPLSSTVYNAASLPTTVTLGSGDSDAFTYDANTNRRTKYQFNINGQSYVGAPTWNANGTLSSLSITDPFNSTDTQNCSYSHDDLARIASVNCGASKWQQNFTYDAFGNITKTVPTGGTGNSFQPTYSETTNRMTNIAGFTPTYDANGNTLNDGAMTRAYDADGFLVSGNGTSVTIDALGRAIDSGFQTATFYSPDGALRVAYKGQVAHQALLYLPGGGFATYDQSGSGLIGYNHPDHLGSIRLGSSPSRTFLASKAFAPFGEVYAASQTEGSFFTGMGNFFNLDTYEFPAREYSDQGRWPSPHPAGLAAVDPTNPQSWNRYAYVYNNPLALTDPSGLCGGSGQPCLSGPACRSVANISKCNPEPPGLSDLLDDSRLECEIDEAPASCGFIFGGMSGIVAIPTVNYALNPDVCIPNPSLCTTINLIDLGGRNSGGNWFLLGLAGGRLPPGMDAALKAAAQKTRPLPRVTPPPPLTPNNEPTPAFKLINEKAKAIFDLIENILEGFADGSQELLFPIFINPYPCGGSLVAQGQPCT